MRKVKLFIAMSLDGYIADDKGGVDWLTGQNNEDTFDSYENFVKDIDTILMGWNTYYQIVTELSPNRWVYEDFTTYVFTHKEHTSSEKIHFINTKPADLIENIKKDNGKDIWICGGSDLVGQLIDNDLIDCYYITIIPTLLGSGIGLFEKSSREIKLKLVSTHSYNGMTDLVYTRR